GGGHLGVERLGLARPAVQEEEDDGFVGDNTFGLAGPRRQEPRQRQPPEGEAADFQERPPVEARGAVMDREHGCPPCSGRACNTTSLHSYHSSQGQAINGYQPTTRSERMRRFSAVVLLMLMVLPAVADEPSAIPSKPEKEVDVVWGVKVPLRDGVKLNATV